MASFSRIGVSSEVGGVRSSSGGDDGVGTLMEFVGKRGVDVGDELVVLFHHIQYACKRIAALVASPFNSTLGKHSGWEVVGARVAPIETPQSPSILFRMKSFYHLSGTLEK